jgi:dTDP-4-dehydrorhamnose reductase
MSTSILVIGRTGQVAHELTRSQWPTGFVVDFVERPGIDLGRPTEAGNAVIEARPAIVVNAAAYTAVDAAQSHVDDAFTINRDGPAALAEACREIGAPLIHYSTDYVFDGTKRAPYLEDDTVNPFSVYGASKAAGDAAIRARLDRHVILRTSWVYSATGSNFVKTMLRLGAERDRLTVVDDQLGSPTAAADIAAATVALCMALAAGKEDGFGMFNFCGGGTTSWYGFAREIFAGAERRGVRPRAVVQPIPAKDYPTPTPRPANSALDCGKIARVHGIAARPWQTGLSACLDELIAPAAVEVRQ